MPSCTFLDCFCMLIGILDISSNIIMETFLDSSLVKMHDSLVLNYIKYIFLKGILFTFRAYYTKHNFISLFYKIFYSIVITKSSCFTILPSGKLMDFTFPSLNAVMVDSIFIASITNKGSFRFISCPFFTKTL